jgi:hypothetical protein
MLFFFRNIKKSVYLPFLYLDEGIPGPNKVSSIFYLLTVFPERIDLFIEDEAVLRSYDSAPRPPPLSLKNVFKCRPLSLFQFVEGKMKMLLGLGDTVQSLSALVGIALGFIMMIPEVTLWIRQEDLTSQNRGLKNSFLSAPKNRYIQ